MKRLRFIGFACYLFFLALAPVSKESPCETLTPLAENFSGVSSRPSERLKIATVNVAEETDIETVLTNLRSRGLSEDADVLLLQEVLHSAGEPDVMPVLLAQALGFNLVSAPGDLLQDGRTRGLATLSRYPVRDAEVIRLKRYNLRFKSRCRIALGVTLDGPFGALRIFNVHLDSRINTGQRIRQLRPVVEAAAAFDGPKIIGGDFNTANILWILHVWPLPYLQGQSAALREMMASYGFFTPFEKTGRTFSYLPLKLDWIFLNGLAAVDAGVEPLPFTDHHGLWVEIAAGEEEPTTR